MGITEKDLQNMERELTNSFSKDPVEMVQCATDIARKLINERRHQLRAERPVTQESAIPLRRAA